MITVDELAEVEVTANDMTGVAGWSPCTPHPDLANRKTWARWIGDPAAYVLVSVQMVEHIDLLPWKLTDVGEEREGVRRYRRTDA